MRPSSPPIATARSHGHRPTLVPLPCSSPFPCRKLMSLKEKPPMNVKRITAVLLVKEIEPLIPFWVDRLGFAKTVEVPDGNKLGFVIFQKNSVEVMYQPYASVEKDAPPAMSSEARKGPTYLYMEVDNLDAVHVEIRRPLAGLRGHRGRRVLF